MKDSTALSQKAHATTSFYHHKTPSNADAGWYLVDQAKHPEVLRLLFEHDPAPIYDLPYMHSEYREQAYDGPLTIQPTTSQSENWLRNWLAEGWALAGLWQGSGTARPLTGAGRHSQSLCEPEYR